MPTSIEKRQPTATLHELRLDVWLWAARFFKTRALAKTAIDGGKVRVNGLACKPAKLVHCGDLIKTPRGDENWEIRVLRLQSVRANPAMALQLFEEAPENTAQRLLVREQNRLDRLGYSAPSGKPDKRARQKITRFERADQIEPD